MPKTISLKEFKDAYTTITNNYVVEITTGKTYGAIYIEDTQEMALFEPKEFEEISDKLSNRVINYLKSVGIGDKE